MYTWPQLIDLQQTHLTDVHLNKGFSILEDWPPAIVDDLLFWRWAGPLVFSLGGGLTHTRPWLGPAFPVIVSRHLAALGGWSNFQNHDV